MDTKERDFASFLYDAGNVPNEDDLVTDEQIEDLEGSSAGAPTIPFDYLAVAEELHSGRIKLQPDRRRNRSRSVADVEAGYRAELEAYLDAARIEPAEAPGATFVEAGAQLSTEPEDIAFELGLGRIPLSDYPKVRRRFAFENHPDRVAPHLRDRAMVRMQIANMLIDDATGKGKAGR